MPVKAVKTRSWCQGFINRFLPEHEMDTSEFGQLEYSTDTAKFRKTKNSVRACALLIII